MGHTIENNCVGCEICKHCGRDRQETWFCDDCGDYTDELYAGDHSDELCWECYKKQFISKICDDCDDTLCAECGKEAEELFLFEGEWVCEECLKNMAERVDTED